MTERIRKHGRLMPAETKLAAWEIVIGERDPSATRHRNAKPHRGMLPDVDFGAAVRDLERRSLLRRVLHRLWRGEHEQLPGPGAEAQVSRSSALPVGRAAARSHIGEAETSGDGLARPEPATETRRRAA